MAWTMASPSPCPLRRVVAASRWNGSNRRCNVGRDGTGPGVGDRQPRVPRSCSSIRDPAAGHVWRIALSTRLVTRLSMSLRSPVTGAEAPRLDMQPAGVAPLRPPERRRRDLGEVTGLPTFDAALAAREREQRVDQSLLMVAEADHLLAGDPQVSGRSRDRRAPPAARCAPPSAVSAARAKRWRRTVVASRTTTASRSSSWSSVSPSSLNSSSGPVSARRRSKLLAEISRAVAVIVRSGLRTRPAKNHPRCEDTTTSVASATAEPTIS